MISHICVYRTDPADCVVLRSSLSRHFRKNAGRRTDAPQQLAAKRSARSSNTPMRDGVIGRRLACARTLCAVAISCVSVAPPLVARADIDTQISLAPLLQLRSLVQEADEVLCEDLLGGGAIKEGGVRASVGQGTVSRVRKILTLQIREQASRAASTAMRERAISRRDAELVASFAREADERLASLLEADAADALKLDDLGMPLPYMRPQKVRLFHRSLVAAQEALDAAFAVFAEDDRREATRLAGAAYKRSVASDALATAGASSGGSLLAAPGYEAARERDDAVTRAIDALPGPAPALFRGDLQNALDNSWREGSAARGRKSDEQ